MHQVVRDTNAWACADCGKCTATCPVSRAGAPYSPRRQVLTEALARLAGAGTEAPSSNPDPTSSEVPWSGLSACLSCGLCDTRCPSGVSITGMVLGLREMVHGHEPESACPHGGALLATMRLMARGGTRQDRLGWLEERAAGETGRTTGSGPDTSLRTSPEQGRVLLWTGCSAYYDAFFPELKLGLLDSTRAAVRLLNALGDVPVVSADERCCGHDLLWNGDRAAFEALARHNVELACASGAEVIVTPCAECLRTWRLDYQPYLPARAPRVLHLVEYLAERLDELGELSLQPTTARRVTFHDPCRLGRHLGVYDPPRQVLAALPGIELVEMERSRGRALCCAGGTWSSCDRYAKSIQVDRLREARASGAEVLITACPKCRIHLRCAMNDPTLGEEIALELRDVADLAAAALGSSSGTRAKGG